VEDHALRLSQEQVEHIEEPVGARASSRELIFVDYLEQLK
jgi:hypothetical protein